MALVLALLLTTLCGVHAASIPSSSLDTMLAGKSDNLEKRDTPNLDKIRRSVLEDMKRLLDSQLAALFENAVTQKAGTQRKRLKSNTKSHPTSTKGDTPDLESIISTEKPQNSELIKVLTDDSLQDPGDEILRNAVDQLLKEDEVQTAGPNNGEVFNNEDQLNKHNSTKSTSEDIFGEDAFDEATLPLINTNDKDRQKGKSNKKGLSHVIIEHAPKTNKNNDVGKHSEDIIDLDEILKSALRDFSGSTSQEHENSRDEKSERRDSEVNNLYPTSSEKREPRIFNYSQTGLRIHDPEDNSFQVDESNNVDIDENTLKPDKPGNNLQDNDDDGELEINSNYTNDVHFKTNQHKHVNRHRKNHKGRQPINNNVSDENHTNNRDDINRVGEDLNKDDDDTKSLKLEENEAKKDHDEWQNLHKKSKYKFGKKRPNKNHHSKRRYRNHDKHKYQNDNKTHQLGAKGHHIIVRLISNSDESNESNLDTIHDTQTHKNPIHSVSSHLRKGHQDSEESIYNRDGHNLSSKENTTNEANASQDDAEGKNKLQKIRDSNINEEDYNVTEHNSITNTDEYGSKERKNVTKEESSEMDNEQATIESKETRVGKKENNAGYEDDIFIENERSVEDNENDAIVDTRKASTEKYEENKEGTEVKTRILDVKENASEDDNILVEKDKKPKKVMHQCHHEQIGIENDEANIIHDLLQNKEMKKSYSLSLTLSTK